MADVGGYPARLGAASAALRPVADDVSGLAAAIAANGTAAGEASGSGIIDSAVSGLSSAVSKAANDTSIVLSRLGDVAELTASGLTRAGG